MEKKDFVEFTVPELKSFLQARGMTVSHYKRCQLVKLAEIAVELDLPLEGDPPSPALSDRRTGKLSDGTLTEIYPLSSVKEWSSSLVDIPDVEQANVLIYLVHSGWGPDRLRAYKTSHGYRLFQDGHVCDVAVSRKGDLLYVKSKCVRETSISERPYTVWTVLEMNGNVVTAGCECPADDGICKHVVGLLFGMSCWCDRHRDRHSQVVTDVACRWDQPRKESRPVKLDDLPYYREKSNLSGPIPKVYNPVTSFPQLGDRDVEKAMYRLVKGGDTNIIEGLNAPSDDSDEEEIDVPSMVDLARIFVSNQDSVITTSFLDFIVGKLGFCDRQIIEK